MATVQQERLCSAITTGVVEGNRIFRDVEVSFAYALPGEEDFIPSNGTDKPAQSRIFVHDRKWGIAPMLIVKGSLKDGMV